MADYFTNFSFIVPLANAEQQTYALELFHQLSGSHQGEDVPAEFPDALKDVAEDAGFELDSGSDPNELWFHSSTGGIDAACAFVQHLLQKFDSASVVTFEWSQDCSKPRTDAYGGGAAIITAKEIRTLNTSDWLRVQTQLQPAT